MALPCFNIKAHIQMSGYDIHLRMLHTFVYVCAVINKQEV